MLRHGLGQVTYELILWEVLFLNLHCHQGVSRNKAERFLAIPEAYLPRSLRHQAIMYGDVNQAISETMGYGSLVGHLKNINSIINSYESIISLYLKQMFSNTYG